MQLTPIEWADYSANPLRYRDANGKIVWACIHASEGCRFCYSEAMTTRYGGRGSPFTKSNMAHLTPFLDEKELHKMLTYKPAAGKTCFVGDMTDIFGEWVPDGLLDRMFAVFALRPEVTWMVLTKRAKRMREYFTDPAYRAEMIGHEAEGVSGIDRHVWEKEERDSDGNLTGVPQRWPWPLPNVWLGVSVESQKYADERIRELLKTPAVVRFISAEPLLEAIALPRGLNWVIVGGESGAGARECDTDWIGSIVDQCKEDEVPCFVKQFGANSQGLANCLACNGSGHDLDEEICPDCYGTGDRIGRVLFKDRKGGNPEEWPASLRVREWPGVAR